MTRTYLRGSSLCKSNEFPQLLTQCLHGKVLENVLTAINLTDIGADTKSRTRDLLITNQLLYQLSYAGVGAIIKTEWLRSKPSSPAGQKFNAT